MLFQIGIKTSKKSFENVIQIFNSKFIVNQIFQKKKKFGTFFLQNKQKAFKLSTFTKMYLTDGGFFSYGKKLVK